MPVVLGAVVLFADRPGRDRVEAPGDEVGGGRVAGAAGLAISSILVAINRAAADAVPPSNVPGGPAGSKGSGAPSSENITAMTATRAGAKARR